MKGITCAVGVVLATVILSCNSRAKRQSPKPPTSPKICNAIIHSNTSFRKKTPPLGDGDIVLLARCRGTNRYAITSADEDHNYHWNLVTMDVLSVESGKWDDKEVNFIYHYTWPKPESGIIVDADVFPFAKGYIFALSMKATKLPVTIQSLERRSYVTPHGELKYFQFKEEGSRKYRQIQQAVAVFESRNKVRALKPVDVVEDTVDEWVLHRRDGWGTEAGSWLYRINKKTFAVEAIP